jgi:hypothetical protein
MHPLCYFRTDNISVNGPFPINSRVQFELDLCEEGQNASHARIDEILELIHRRSIPLRHGRDHRGNRQLLKARRKSFIYQADQIRRRAQEHAFRIAKRDAFIGPKTISMENGHPF